MFKNKDFSNFLLVFSYLVIVASLFDAYIGNDTIPDGGNAINEFEESPICNIYREIDPTQCWRIGHNATENSLKINVSEDFYNGVAELWAVGGCGSNQQFKKINFEKGGFIFIEENPLSDRTVNYMDVYHPRGKKVSAIVKKKRTDNGIATCEFRAPLNFGWLTKSSFYIYSNDERIILKIVNA